MTALEQLQQLFDDKKIKYSWEFCDKAGRGIKEPFYAYMCTGITAYSTCLPTPEQAIEESIEMLLFSYDCFNNHKTARQDEATKALDELAVAAYNEDEERFKQICGLTIEAQLLGTEYDDYEDA